MWLWTPSVTITWSLRPVYQSDPEWDDEVKPRTEHVEVITTEVVLFWSHEWLLTRSTEWTRSSSGVKDLICCLLWINKTRVKEKTYIWVSVRRKTKNLKWGIYTPHRHWGCLLWINKTKVIDKMYMSVGVMKVTCLTYTGYRHWGCLLWINKAKTIDKMYMSVGVMKVTRLTYTGLAVELEHLKIETRLTIEKFGVNTLPRASYNVAYCPSLRQLVEILFSFCTFPTSHLRPEGRCMRQTQEHSCQQKELRSEAARQ